MWFYLLLALIPQATPQKPTAVRGKVLAAETGAPLKRAYVSIRQTARDAESLTAQTDATGVYEFSNLQPGKYALSAAKPGYVLAPYRNQDNEPDQVTVAAGQTVENIDFKLTRSVVIAGNITASDGDPLVGATVMAMQRVYRMGQPDYQQRATAQTDDHGDYRLHGFGPGRYYVQASKSSYSGPGGPGGTAIYGTERYSEPIRVAAGEERKNINLTLREISGYAVTGRVLDAATGQPLPNVFIYVNPESFQNGGTNGSAQTKPDGTFRIADLMPGRYRMNGNVPPIAPQPVSLTPGQPMPPPVRTPPITFQRAFEVGSSDAPEVTIRVGQSGNVKGIVKAEGGQLPARMDVQLYARSAQGAFTNFVASSVATEEGKFTLSNVQAGTYQLNIFGQADGGRFYVSSVNGKIDPTITVSEGATSTDVSATISFGMTAISGKALEVAVKPADKPGEAGEREEKVLPNATVALISADPAKRREQRYFQTSRAFKATGFKFTVIPGDYYLVIWPGDDAGQVLDPEVFTMLEKHLVKITAEPYGKITQDLRLTPELRAIADAFAQ